jgi:hypothetical protein
MIDACFRTRQHVLKHASSSLNRLSPVIGAGPSTAGAGIAARKDIATQYVMAGQSLGSVLVFLVFEQTADELSSRVELGVFILFVVPLAGVGSSVFDLMWASVRRHHQVLAGNVDVSAPASTDVFDVLVRDERDRDISRIVELVLLDQMQQ